MTDKEAYVNRRKSEETAKGESCGNVVDKLFANGAEMVRDWTVLFNCGVCHALGAFAHSGSARIWYYCPHCGSRITPRNVQPTRSALEPDLGP
jgi:hypothetical protein